MKKRWRLLSSFIEVSLLWFSICAHTFAAPAARQKGYPPISPGWVLDHWVWEDDVNSVQAVREMIDGYEKHGIPVGVVLIDSPWATEYNNFSVNEALYPKFASFVRELHRRGIKVVLWVTAIINQENRSGKGEPKTARLYEEARGKGFLLNKGKSYSWWKGRGAFLDVTNPEAIKWWHRLQDRMLQMGVDGWKVDEAAFGSLPTVAQGKYGRVSKRKYMRWVYTDFYDYGLSQNLSFAVLSRSVDKLLSFAPIPKAPATWVGDQKHSWIGLREAFQSMLRAGELGYAVMGSDTGGYHGDAPITKQLLLRWAQLSAWTPLFENGGHGQHFPWLFDEETVRLYRRYVKLHLELKPYFVSLMWRAHLGQGKVLTPDSTRTHFFLGDHLLVAPLLDETDQREVSLPKGEWLELGTGEVFQGPKTLIVQAPLARIPVFLKAGAIIPLQVQDSEAGHGGLWSRGADTFWMVAGAENHFSLYREGGEEVKVCLQCGEGEQLDVMISSTGRAKIILLEHADNPKQVKINFHPIPRAASIVSLAGRDESYYFDSLGHRLWIRSDETKALKITIR